MKTIQYLQANQGVIDVDAKDKEIETLFANLGTATENLKFYKTKILAAIETVEQENTHCLDNMKTKKDELAKKFSNNKEVVTILSHKFYWGVLVLPKFCKIVWCTMFLEECA